MSKTTNKLPLKRLFKYLRPYKLSVTLIAFFSIIGNILTVFAPLIIGKIVDMTVSVSNVNFSEISKLLFILAGMYLISSLCSWLYSFLAVIISAKVGNDIRKEAFYRLISLPLKNIDNFQFGDVLSRFTADTDQITEAVSQILTQFFSAIVIIAASLGFMLYISPIVTIAVIFSVPLVYLVSSTVSKKSSSRLSKQQKMMGELGGFAEEHIKGARVIKAFNYEKESCKKFASINRQLYHIGVKAQFTAAFTNPSTRLVTYFTYVLVAVTGGISAIYFDFTVGNLASFLAYAALFSRPFNEFTAVTSQIISGLTGAKRIFDIIDIPLNKITGNLEISDASGKFEFNNVNFSYEPQKPLIKNFNLNVQPGQKIAIVGPTGAGKTTMINLLMRFYDVNSGSILMDGINIQDITKVTYRKNFGMVLQDTWLFKGTVAQNIAYGKINAGKEEIVLAAQRAYAHSFIIKLPQGYNTVIDENGENISSGQKQLITIARAMLLVPPILILDEATSSVDILTEQKIQRAFREIMKGRTSFVIAHRLSTIRDADMIIVMNHGQVIEQGKHDELLQAGGLYFKLYNSQFDKKFSKSKNI